ncbi:NAD(P)/FAD-dependent oxidoreductase [Geomicrobium sp. JCM 19039]|uniref:NAD(P)/FAD-dependent oxidoreductase n=1 Tax=Geomicrobium sp. JCM 19039 TaxID=1460636 RepID=UPI00045F3D70|nr:NAD(P)/FAD-dependent oxidoreductase [Geomicrobium sp. JCM 19039]GAK13741.1 NADH dehydrogenase [Geomicrobium sp. JCM 19039]
MAKKPQIVVLGAGYGGMMAVSQLQKKMGSGEAHITLISKHKYHYQTTWLHEPAAGTMKPDDARIEIEKVLNSNRSSFVQGTVSSIDKEAKKVTLQDGQVFDYDYLVIAVGAKAETFGVEGVFDHSYHKWTIDGVREVKDHIEFQFSKYRNESIHHDEDLTFVVAGAGFTGIEFIGELSERVPKLCEFYDVPREKVKMYVIEAAPTALPGFDPELVEYAMNLLEHRGVEFKINTPISEVKDSLVILKDGEEIPASTIVWATGVRGNPLIEEAGFEAMRGRVKVDPDLRAPGEESVFIIGDCSLMINEETERPFPPTAQIAMQQGSAVAENILSLIKGGSASAFKPEILGTLASLGGKEAMGTVNVSFLKGKKLYGRSAYFMKHMSDNRYLMKLGGIGLVLTKGRNPF